MSSEMQLSPETLNELGEALLRYEEEVNSSKLRKATKRTYCMHAQNFVRWLAGDFEPGSCK